MTQCCALRAECFSGNEVLEEEEDRLREESELLIPESWTAQLEGNMLVMRCGSHTFQLALNDLLKPRATKKRKLRRWQRRVIAFLTRIRGVVKDLRTAEIIDMILKRGLPLPLLDNATRWSSTGVMTDRFEKLEDFVKETSALRPSLKLPDSDWAELKRLNELLREPFLATKRFQREDLTPGEELILQLSLTSLFNLI